MLKTQLYTIFIFFLCQFLWSCTSEKTVELNEIMEREGLMSKEMDGTVFLFWDKECPLCLNYSKDLETLEKEYANSTVQFVYVFCGNEYKSTKLEDNWNESFFNKKVILDTNLILTKCLKATVTPQAIVVNNRNLEIPYSGKIDNWIVSLGQKRQVVDSFYLEDALKAITNNEKPKTTITTPVGCYIEQ